MKKAIESSIFFDVVESIIWNIKNVSFKEIVLSVISSLLLEKLTIGLSYLKYSINEIIIKAKENKLIIIEIKEEKVDLYLLVPKIS